MNRQGILIVVSGFSGAGKGTIMKALTERYEDMRYRFQRRLVHQDLERKMEKHISSRAWKNLSR